MLPGFVALWSELKYYTAILKKVAVIKFTATFFYAVGCNKPTGL